MRAICFGVLMVVGTALFAQGRGFVDLDQLDGFDEDDVVVDVKLGGWILGLAREAARESGDKDVEVLQRVESIRVKILSDTHDRDQFAASGERLSRVLLSKGWEEVATIRDDDDRIYVMVLGDKDAIDGITVLLWGDSDEAVLVNVAGRFTARDVAAIIDNDNLLRGDLNVDIDI